MTADSLIHRLRGEELGSVIFVRDYCQLNFDGPVLSCFTWPVISAGGDEWTIGRPGYRDQLCAFIGASVTGAQDDPAVGLVLAFGARSVVVNPRPEELVGPEIAMVQLPSGEWDVWRPGESTFSEL